MLKKAGREAVGEVRFCDEVGPYHDHGCFDETDYKRQRPARLGLTAVVPYQLRASNTSTLSFIRLFDSATYTARFPPGCDSVSWTSRS